MVNQEDARLFLTILMELRDLPDNSRLNAGLRKSEAGICDGSRLLLIARLRHCCDQYDRYKVLDRWMQYRNYLFRKWPEYTGRINFPVPVPADEPIDVTDLERHMYLRACNWKTMWQGPYGAARYRLLQFMIDEIQRDYPQIIVEPRKNDPDLEPFKFY